jgi:hypothetical protein
MINIKRTGLSILYVLLFTANSFSSDLDEMFGHNVEPIMAQNYISARTFLGVDYGTSLPVRKFSRIFEGITGFHVVYSQTFFSGGKSDEPIMSSREALGFNNIPLGPLSLSVNVSGEFLLGGVVYLISNGVAADLYDEPWDPWNPWIGVNSSLTLLDTLRFEYTLNQFDETMYHDFGLSLVSFSIFGNVFESILDRFKVGVELAENVINSVGGLLDLNAYWFPFLEVDKFIGQDSVYISTGLRTPFAAPFGLRGEIAVAVPDFTINYYEIGIDIGYLPFLGMYKLMGKGLSFSEYNKMMRSNSESLYFTLGTAVRQVFFDPYWNSNVKKTVITPIGWSAFLDVGGFRKNSTMAVVADFSVSFEHDRALGEVIQAWKSELFIGDFVISAFLKLSW